MPFVQCSVKIDGTCYLYFQAMLCVHLVKFIYYAKELISIETTTLLQSCYSAHYLISVLFLLETSCGVE